MKSVKLLHNPGAGNENYTKNELISMIEAEGFVCVSFSGPLSDMKEIQQETDFLVVAGGDGTIRNVAEELMEEGLNQVLPLALLPSGTANNIAQTLGITGTVPEVIHSWHSGRIKKVDVGIAYHSDEAIFFLEGFGYGLFPELMHVMKSAEKKNAAPGDKIHKALEVLEEMVGSHEPKFCRLQIDGLNCSGKFILIEIMNMASIGPKLDLAPLADPGDGELEVILVPAAQQKRLAAYVAHHIRKTGKISPFSTLKAKSLHVYCEGQLLHADDKIIDIDASSEVRIELLKGALQFLVPDKNDDLGES